MADQAAPQHTLPPSIQAAWGLAGRLGKGPRPALTIGKIVAAAVAVADSDGLDRLSMSRVASRLGTATMSLYRYLSAKTELLDLMVDAVYGPPPEVAATDPDWRSGLTVWAATQLQRVRAHPWVLRIPTSGPPITPNQVAWMEFGLGTLRATGLSVAEKLSTILLVSGFVRTWATLTTDLGASDSPDAATPDRMLHYATNLRALLADGRFPELRSAVAAGVLDQSDIDDDYAFGLERVLDGIGVLVQARA